MAATTVAEFGVGTACCAVAKSEVSREVATEEASEMGDTAAGIEVEVGAVMDAAKTESTIDKEKQAQKIRKKLQRQKKRNNKAFKARSSDADAIVSAYPKDFRSWETVDFRPALVLDCRASQVL